MEEKKERTPGNFSLTMLIAMVVGSMVGAGVFSLPHRFAASSGVLASLIAWVVAGFGMLMLAFVFQNLANRRPDIDAGVFAYAKAGFGDFTGFLSAYGYWASACVGNVFYWVLIKATLSIFFPAFGAGNTVIAVAVSSVMIWSFYFMVLRGVKEAAAINKIVTIAKILPLIFFIIVVIIAFKVDVFMANFWGSENVTAGDIYEQVKATMMVTVFVFIGIEGASVYSRYAKDRRDVGKATIIGFLGVLALFASISILSFGILPRAELAALSDPSVGSVLASVVGDWGAIFVGAGLIVSVLGAYLAWTLMCAEVLFLAAKNKDMPKFLTKENANNVPSNALLQSTIMIQTILAITIFSDDALTLALTLAAALSLIPYLLSGAYALKLTITKETYETNKATLKKDLIVALLATFYGIFLVYAAGTELLLLACIIYASGIILYVIARKEQKLQLFTNWEKVLLVAVVVGAIAGIIALFSGTIEYKDDNSAIKVSTGIDYIKHIEEGNMFKLKGSSNEN
ncbi:MAG: basic amino acid/polyamine antiporter [Desulfosarcina sp.]